MVGGLVKNKGVSVGEHHLGEHHLGEHAAYPFAAGEDRGLFHRLFAGKKHFAQEPPGKALVLLRRRELAQPADKIELLIVEIRSIFFREIGVAYGHPPAEASFVRRKLPGQDLKEGGLCQAAVPDEGDLVALVDREGEVLKHGNPVDRLGKTLDLQNDVATGPFRSEGDVGIFSGGSRHVLDGELLKQPLP